MSRQRGEMDWIEEAFFPTLGSTGPLEFVASDDDEHGPHVFLYIPDLTMETGWSTHRVPERVAARPMERRPIGFRHPERRPRHG